MQCVCVCLGGLGWVGGIRGGVLVGLHIFKLTNAPFKHCNVCSRKLQQPQPVERVTKGGGMRMILGMLEVRI